MLAERLPAEDEAGADLIVPARANALGETEVRLRLYGRAGAPLVLVAGGISSHRIVCGEGGWWGGIVGAGKAIDLNQFQVLGFDFAPGEDRRAAVTPAAQAALLEGALDTLGVATAHAFVGASYGAMIGLALATRGRLARLVAIAAAHRPAPLAQAWRGVQRRIVEEALARGAPHEGLALARQLAMITYRSGDEFAQRFDGALDSAGRSDLDRYLVARGNAFAAKALARRWLSLSEAIDRFSVNPADVGALTTLIACPTDQLAPLADIEELARLLPRCAGLKLIASLYGHDCFLKEDGRLSPLISEALNG